MNSYELTKSAAYSNRLASAVAPHRTGATGTNPPACIVPAAVRANGHQFQINSLISQLAEADRCKAAQALLLNAIAQRSSGCEVLAILASALEPDYAIALLQDALTEKEGESA